MRKRHPHDFRRVLELKGNERPWFSEISTDLRDPIRVEGTNIFVEGNQNANSITRFCLRILEHFGMRPMIKVTAK